MAVTAIALAQRAATAHYRRLYEAEGALRERDEDYRRLFDASPDGVVLIGPDGCMSRANQAQARMFGFDSPDALIGVHATMLVAPSDRERATLVLSSRLGGADVPPVELRVAPDRRDHVPRRDIGDDPEGSGRHGLGLHLHHARRQRAPAGGGGVVGQRDAVRIAHRSRPTAIMVTRAGVALYANDKAARMFGCRSVEELQSLPVIERFAPECRGESEARMRRRALGLPLPDVETVALRADGSRFPIHLAVSQFQLPDGPANIAFLTDISERREAEAALRESEERHRSIIEQLNDVYYRTDRDGRITMLSPSAAHLYGFASTSEMIGQPIESLWEDPSQRAVLLAALREHGFVRDYETTAVKADGTPFTIAVSSHRVHDASGAPDGVEGIIRDMTDRKQSEAALRALARHLDSVREEEHTRIARQIHDELGQALTALRLDLAWVGGKLPKGNSVLRRRIDAAVALTDETIAVGQRIVGELRPPILDDLGLAPAVEWYVQRLAKRSGLHIEFDAGAEEPVVPDHLAIAAYRIVQEALTNVARHAQATHAWVRLGERDGAVTIEIRDDGQGLSEEVSGDPHSFGIVGMRERAAAQGGELVIASSPGAGTTVRVTFPPDRRKKPRGPR